MSAELRTPLSRIQGLGSAKSGTTHFLHQRMTAVVLIPLAIWFVIAGLAQVGNSQASVAAFFAHPVNAILMFLFLSAALYHMTIGIQVIIEDYVHCEAVKLLLVIVNRLAAFAIGASAALALAGLALGH
jgi:succinate dehydrogenase / fumarate reductase membrane anchor subunit